MTSLVPGTRREHHRAHHPFPGTQREKTGGTEGHNPRTLAGHCPLGPDYRRVAGDDDSERGSVVEFKAASPGSATSRGRRRGGSCGTQLAGGGAQRFLFADSRVTASGDHRLRGGIPSSGNLSVEGTRRGRGLISYGPSLAAMWRQSAIMVAKVLKGVKPADLPVEQPTKFELAVNLRTAKSLDLTIPPSVLLRADEVIE